MSLNDTQVRRLIKTLFFMEGMTIGMCLGLILSMFSWFVPAAQTVYPAVVMGGMLLGGTLGVARVWILEKSRPTMAHKET